MIGPSEENNTRKGGDRITPVVFRPDRDVEQKPLGRMIKWGTVMLLCLILTGLAAAAGFVFTARKATIDIEPIPDRIAIEGGLATPRVGDRFLLRPGSYTLKAFKTCYTPLERPLIVGREKNPVFKFTMEALSGQLTLRLYEDNAPDRRIEDAMVFIDDRPMGPLPIVARVVPAGKRQLSIRAGGYREYHGQLEIESCGQLQEIDVFLTPGGAFITISSVPPGATIFVDGKTAGETPIRKALSEGPHEILLSAKGYKPWKTSLEVVTGQAREFKDIQLERADGRLVVESKPGGARVMVGERYAGQTPLEAAVSPDRDHMVRLTKTGYEQAVRSVRVGSEEQQTITVNLTPVEGIVHFEVVPDGAELSINGIPKGKVPRELRLIAVPHRVDIRKNGYLPFQTQVTPRPGFPQEIKVLLKPIGSAKAAGTPKTAQSNVFSAPNGYALKRVQPRQFTMGSSRREQGRRSNETLRKINLSRPFYMGVKEVTNGEFREFSARHDSGVVKNHSLNRDDMPVVQVTWEQAALFCNWLSRRASLPPAFVKINNSITAVAPLTTGYRLPTEAEWEYCARFDGSRVTLKYPWGDRFPPSKNSGNFADASAKDLLPNIIEGYNDGHKAAASPGSFRAGALGLFDMGGNVAEWCHDYYAIHSASARTVATDTAGPKTGKFRVIRGSSWKDAGIGSLRLSYRDYGNTQRDDLGFRVCRYAE